MDKFLSEPPGIPTLQPDTFLIAARFVCMETIRLPT